MKRTDWKSARHADEWPTLFLLDLKVTHLDQAMDAVLAALRESGQLADSGDLAEVTHQLQRHADLGPDALENGVAIVHEQIERPGVQTQVLVRLAEPLKDLYGPDGVLLQYIWVLFSDQKTHPHIPVAAEFAKLMEDPEFRAQVGVCQTEEEILQAYDQWLDEEVNFEHHIPEELRRTGKLFGGIIADIRRRAPHFISDFTDGVTTKTLASVFFLFFACLAPAVAFGGLLSVLTEGTIGVIEMIVATAVCGTVYSIFSGQPLTILGSTGPVIIFMGILYQLTKSLGIPYLPTLAWVGIWTMVFLLVLAITEACSLIRYFTRFTDETFAALISIIFIVEAVKDMAHGFSDSNTSYDTALLSLILALGTFYLSMSLVRLRTGPYLRRQVREFLADFGPTIAIAVMTGLALWLHPIELETLAVPQEFATTSGRSWFVNPFEAPTWVWAASTVPALLVSILLYLDQNITVRLVNDKRNKLQKGSGYHLDLSVVAVLVGLSSLFGLPWMVAATVRSLNHVRSLQKIESKEGEEVITGTIETRMTGLLVHLAVGASLLFLGLLSQVPMSVLFGLFLFMGIASMRGNQLFERMRLWIMDPASYPPTYYLRAVPTSKVHWYTAIQATCLVVLWIVKASVFGILFPLFIALLVPVRMLLGRFFKAEHLALLDAEEEPEQEEHREAI
ncbi:MAG: mannitol/fructose-specific phosphotransferase system IIA component (Ntr-type) [Myxococcota bacterium]|jgi:mannitol/fructose-specific phosphotransferase system IIA component (Ntr-type)